MEHKQRKLPTSRKAMEYRVYWLERKLTHMKLNETRELNRVNIEAMPDSAMKDLMHLNNEFHRANDAAHGLKKFTEELNQDTLKQNERSVRLQDVAINRLATTDRVNRQSQRLQERGRKINKESLRTTALSRAIYKASLGAIEQVGGRIKEANYLSGLTRAQHEATDALNLRTRNLNQETVRTTSETLKLNREMADTTANGQGLNQKSIALQEELDQLKAALRGLGENTEQLNSRTQNNLKKIAAAEKRATIAASKAEALVLEGQEQIKTAHQLLTETDAQNKASIAATDQSIAVKESTEQWLRASDTRFTYLSETFAEQVADLLVHSREEIEAHQVRQSATLSQLAGCQEQRLTQKVDAALSQSEQQLLEASETNRSALEQHFTQINASFDESIRTAGEHIDQISQAARLDTSETLNQFGHDARLRFTAFDTRANQLTEGFVTQSSEELETFHKLSNEKLNSADELLKVLSGRTTENLALGEQFVAETREANDETQKINAATVLLNSDTQFLIGCSQEAISRIDGAIQEVNSVRRELFRETRELQDRSSQMNEAGERLQKETETLNLRSMDIQSDTMQTQSLSQEINNHSLALNDETQKIHASYLQTKASNTQLVSELNSLRASLFDLRETATEQLQAAELSQQDNNRTAVDLRSLGEESRLLNTRANQLLEQTGEALNTCRQQNLTTENIIANAERIHAELEDLKADVLASGRDASEAADNANQAVTTITAFKDELRSATQRSEAMTIAATDSIHALKAITTETQELKAEAEIAQHELKQSVSNSQQINDEFMRGLEAVSNKAEKTDLRANEVLTDTRTLQAEIHNVLQLRHGIEGFQQSVDICQERLDGLYSSVSICQEDAVNQADLIGQYQRRIDAFQGDVSRYRECVAQFETRARQLETAIQDVGVRLDDADQAGQERLGNEVEKMRCLELDMRQSLAEKQAQVDHSIQEIKTETELQLTTIQTDILKDVDERVENVAKKTDSQLEQNDKVIQGLSSDFNNFNRTLMDEIGALKTQTSVVKEQHSLFQQEQRTQLSEQKKRTQNQDFELDTVRHQLENYQRLLETQLDNQPDQEMQQRVKSIENNLRQHQRMLKNHESQQEKLNQDDQIGELKNVVTAMGQSMQEVIETNDELKRSLEDTRHTNQTLNHKNQALEVSLQTRQEEVSGALQRIQRLESRETNFEDMISALKSRDTDTQKTLLQMRSAVKDSTRAMRETQKTLHRLNQPDTTEKKRDWLTAPRQAVMTSFFAAVITALTFLGIDEVDASFLKQAPLALLETNSPRDMEEHPTLDKTLNALMRANNSIADLGEFAWPVNFGIVDPKAIEYRAHHQGISITGELGDPVVAVNDGKVIFAGDEIRGYGNLIVIQHQDDLVSIYANNQFNYVKVGDSVRRGQLIGDIGQLFNEEAAGLYFEMRHNGEAEDPFNYLRNNQNIDSLSSR